MRLRSVKFGENRNKYKLLKNRKNENHINDKNLMIMRL